MSKKIQQAVGIGASSISVFPTPVIANVAPTSSDIQYPLGQVWVRKDTGQAWILSMISSGAATWAIASPGASDVDTINSLSPVGGDILIAGGTNITDVNAGHTVTLNLDDAITLATSVTSPIFSSAAAMAISVAAGSNITMKMGDAAAANKISFVDSASAEVAKIDSDGKATFVKVDGIIGSVTSAAITGTTITAGTSVVSPIYTSTGAVDTNFNAVAGQDLIFMMGDNAAANKMSFKDSDSVEVAYLDSNGGLSVTTMTFSGLLTANASATINTAGAALNLATDNAAGAVNIGTGTTIRAIGIGNAGGVAHTVAIGSAAAGAITVDTAAGISLDSATASNFTVTGAADLTLRSTLGSIVINAEEAVADAIQLQSAAGGLDVDTALQMNLTSSQAAATAIRVYASDAAGGIDVDCGSGGFDLLATAGAINITGQLNSSIDVAGAGVDLTLASTAGRVVMNGEEAAADACRILSAAGGLDADVALQMSLISSQAAADAVRIQASDAAGGIDIDAGTGGIAVDTTGAISLDAAAASNITVTGAFDFTVNSTAGSMILRSGEATDDAVLIDATNAAGGITLQTGGGDITVSSTVKQIHAEMLWASGTDLVVSQSPMLQSNATTGVAPTGTTGAVNLMYLQDGCLMEQFILGAGQTIIAPRMSANGLNIALDVVDNEGAEYNFGARANAKHAYTIGTDDAFFIEATIYLTDISGVEPLAVGFRKVEANNAVFADYTDYAAIGMNKVTSATHVVMFTELNAGGQTITDSTDNWGGDAAACKIAVFVSAAGVVTFEINGVAASAAPAFTFDNGDVVMPFIHFLHSADTTAEVGLQTLRIGFQP